MTEPKDKRAAVYFDSYTEMMKFIKVIPQAAANVAYFDPSVQKWTMIDREKRSNP
jgi:hypothetical protein